MTRADKVLAFIARYCRVPEGKLVGQKMKLDPFQVRFIRAVYDNPAGTQEGILSIARKNGKSGLIAAIVLVHLVGPEARQNSQVVSGARSRRQASIVFNLASKMVGLDPDLRKLVRIVPSDKRLIGLAMNAEYVALAAEAGTAHGLSPVLAILDELGQVKGDHDGFVEAIETAQGAYDDGLRLTISTQAASDADMLSIRIDDAERSGDPKIVCHVYSAPAAADLMDVAGWEAANPALGSFRSRVELEQMAAKAQRMPSVENGFRNLYLNQRVMRFTPLVSPSIWKIGNPAIDESAFYEGEVFGGLDLSLTTDLTAFVLIAEKNGIWHVKPTFWTPEASLKARADRDRAPYVKWAQDGFLLTTPGLVVDYDFVAADMLRITRGMNVNRINFDRFKMDVLLAALGRIDATLPLEKFGQGYVSMSPAIGATEELFLNERVRHGGHPVLTMCAAQAVVTKDAAENRKLDKSKSTGRIDGMVALAMAVGAATMAAPVNTVSAYEQREVVFL